MMAMIKLAKEYGKEEASCKIRSTFKVIRDSTFDILSKTTLKELSAPV